MRPRPRVIAGLLDETAHVGTGLLLLAAWEHPAPDFAAGLLVGSVLLDLDHVPDAVGIRILRPGPMRPRPHSVGTLLVLSGIARSWRSRAAAGALVGVTAHIARDLATGTNSVPLLWPFSKRPFSIPYGAYAAGLAVLAGLGAAQSRTRFGASTPRVAPRKSTTAGAEAST
jgi:membrane-bound metal-dependent hydrolase YbcI (DUF457 family)